ncbi:MAG: RNA polymerase sigma factor, partial [Planctomycetota bacterium]
MHRTSDESLFVAFRDERDVDALGQLFRRHAEELLRLAVFMAPRPTDAEDLVQATFLSAIARAETYRDGHRVMSWLCGILTNHARMLRRAQRRDAAGRVHAAGPVVAGAAAAAA